MPSNVEIGHSRTWWIFHSKHKLFGLILLNGADVTGIWGNVFVYLRSTRGLKFLIDNLSWRTLLPAKQSRYQGTILGISQLLPHVPVLDTKDPTNAGSTSLKKEWINFLTPNTHTTHNIQHVHVVVVVITRQQKELKNNPIQ